MKGEKTYVSMLHVLMIGMEQNDLVEIKCVRVMMLYNFFNIALECVCVCVCMQADIGIKIFCRLFNFINKKYI